jgi:hypothetical protein
MLLRKLLLLVWITLLMSMVAPAQRSYRPGSVLNAGAWYKIAIEATGIYRLDLPFLNNLGINTSNLSSASIRLFGNGGQMLAESNAGPWTDDLQENAIMVMDGGDGILSGSDYILFYANGPDYWLKDSLNQRFIHQKNLYSDRSFYFLSVGGSTSSPGKRVAAFSNPSVPNITITASSGRYFHELDTVNFLSGGKEWYGEEFSNAPGKVLARSFTVNAPNLIAPSSLTIQNRCLARSAGGGSSFDIRVNNTSVGQLSIQPIGTGQYDLFAREGSLLATAIISQSNPQITYTYSPGSFNAQGWLNWFELFYRQQLSLGGINQLPFRIGQV